MHSLLAKPDTPLGVIIDPLIVHDQKLADEYLQRLRGRQDLVGRFRCPEGMALVTWSNYQEKTLAEQSFELLGITNAVVLGKDVQHWKHELKLTLTLEWLESGACKADTICWMDARDAVLVGDPARILKLLEASGRDILFSSTDWIVSDLPEARAYSLAIAPAGCPTPYLCAGVLVAKRHALIELLHQAIAYVGKSMSKVTPTCDQAIFNVLRTELGARIAIDYWQRFALRAALNEPYLVAGERSAERRRIERRWWWQVAVNTRIALRRLPALFHNHPTEWSRFAARWAVIRRLRAIKTLLRERSHFSTAVDRLRETPWFC